MPAINRQSLMVGVLVAGAACLPGVVLSQGSIAGAAPLVLATGGMSPTASEGVTVEPTEVERSPDPTSDATVEPSQAPSADPTGEPTADPTGEPTEGPTGEPTSEPTAETSNEPSPGTSDSPTSPSDPSPTAEPTIDVSSEPTPDEVPSPGPTADPTDPGVVPEEPVPTVEPTPVPSPEVVPDPTPEPTAEPSPLPTSGQGPVPDPVPTAAPTLPGQGGGGQPTQPDENDDLIIGAVAGYGDPTAPGSPDAQAPGQGAPSGPQPDTRPGQQVIGEADPELADSSTSRRGNELSGVVARAETSEGDSESSDSDRSPVTNSSLGRLAESQQVFDGTPEWVEGFLNSTSQNRSQGSAVNSNQAAGVMGAEEQEAGGQLAGQGNVFQRGLAIMGGVKPLLIFSSLAGIGLGLVFAHFMWRSRSIKV